MDTNKQLSQLVERMQKTFGDRLVSLILYGSAAGGDFSEQYSDLNILCVLKNIGPQELAESEPIFHWWREHKNPPPVLLSEAEVAGSTDCFPIEYQDMQQRRRVLTGRDVVEGLVIDRSFYRAQVEYELRSKMLRLRQKAASVMHDPELLGHLMADSLSTFLVLGRHGLRLAGFDPGDSRRGTVSKLSEHFGANAAPLEKLIDVREGKLKAKALDGRLLLGEYLKSVEAIVNAVDRIEK